MKLRLQLLKDSKSKLLDGTLIATVIFLSLVLVRLKGINNEFNMERNKHLKKVQRKLQQEYKSLLIQKETYWYDKANQCD